MKIIKYCTFVRLNQGATVLKQNLKCKKDFNLAACMHGVLGAKGENELR